LRQRLTETPGDDVHPLDIHGRRVIDCHEQLVGILRNRLGQNHADFFAQPAQAAGSRSIVWYTTAPGEVVDVATLPPEEKQRLAQRAERILGDVEGLAVQSANDGPAGRTVGELLHAAAQVPSNAMLFSVGGKVVTVLWGHRSGSAAHAPAPTAREALSATAPVHTTVQVAPAPAIRAPVAENKAARRPHWLVPAFLALVLVALLAWAWQSDLLLRLAGPEDDLSARIAAVEARNQTLAARIAELKKTSAPLKCVPEPVPSPQKQPAKQSHHSPSGPVAFALHAEGT
jgi:hypothetical protein